MMSTGLLLSNIKQKEANFLYFMLPAGFCYKAGIVYISVTCGQWALMLDIGMAILQHCLRSVKFSHSVVSNTATPWTAVCHAFFSITDSQGMLKLVSIEAVMASNHLILCCPLFLLPSIFPSIRIFSNESALPIRWLKYWSFSISPSSEYSGLISFRFDLLEGQGTLKSLPQDHSSKASILRHLAFFMVQCLTSVHDYWKNHCFDQTDLCW